MRRKRKHLALIAACSLAVTTSSDSAVQTGDTTNLIIPFAFMFASAAAVIWLTVKRNRFRQER